MNNNPWEKIYKDLNDQTLVNEYRLLCSVKPTESRDKAIKAIEKIAQERGLKL